MKHYYLLTTKYAMRRFFTALCYTLCLYTFVSCSVSGSTEGSGINSDGGGVKDTRTTLSEGPAVDAAASDTNKDATFTGAAGLSLSAADFEVTTGATIIGVSVASDTAMVSVSFAENTSTTLTLSYTVSIASDSTKIKGSGTVVITQAADSGTGSGTDKRATLTAGPAVSAAASDTNKAVTFTGAAGLTLGATDFEVTTGATITGVSVASDTATVATSFAANASATLTRAYTVSIASGSTKIKGSTTVAITQATAGGGTDTRPTLTAGLAVNAVASDISKAVTFTGAAGLSLGTADFEVTTGGTITGVSVASDTATVAVSFAANTSLTLPNTYTVSIASSSTKIKGTGTVVITQEAIVRKALGAGPAVSAAASDISKSVTFTGAVGLTLSATDFAVTSGATITGVSVASDTATVAVSFAANASATASKTYTVSIASGSTKIKGSATVAITQAADSSKAPVVWYISPNDDPQGAIAGSANTVKDVLAQIKTAKGKNSFTGGKKAVIVINGTLTPASEGMTGQKSMVVISGVGSYPPLVLRGGSSGGTLDAENKMRVLNIAGNDITIAAGLTLANGNTVAAGEVWGGGIYLENTTLAMTGGAITNSKAGYGGGVFVNGYDKSGNPGSFTMSGGTISGCVTDNGSGAGVYLEFKAQFTLTGTGAIKDNGLDGKTENGGGVYVNGSCDFTMGGGEISGNKAYKNGGAVANYSKLVMTQGTITNNTAPAGLGSGVFTTQYGGVFTKTGGTVSGNNGAPDVVP